MLLYYDIYVMRVREDFYMRVPHESCYDIMHMKIANIAYNLCISRWVNHICVGEQDCYYSGNGLSPVGTEPSPEPMLAYYQSNINDIFQWNSNKN